MASIADIEIPLERIEALSRKLHLDEAGESTPEELAEYDRFIQETVQSAEESQWARLGIALVLGIISREEAAELAKDIDEPSTVADIRARMEIQQAEEAEEDLIEELRVLVSEATEFDVDFAVADKIFTEEDSILHEAEYWGSNDTVVREGSYDVFSRSLIGKDWPAYGDGLTEDELKSFLEALKLAHDRLLTELQTAQKD